MKKFKFRTIEEPKKMESLKDGELSKLELVKGGGACFPGIICIMCLTLGCTSLNGCPNITSC